MSFPWKPLGAVLAAAAVIGALAYFFWPDGPEPEPRGACDIVIDVTGQPGYEWVEKTFEAGKTQLRQECAERVMFANLVTDYSANSPCSEVNVDTWVKPSGNSFTDEDNRQAAWERYFNDVTRMATCGNFGVEDADPATAAEVKYKGSDILTAISISAQQLGPIEGPRTLFLVSDMINTMPPMDGMPSADEIRKTIKKLNDSAIIPDLTGVDVVMVGVGTNSDIPPQKQAAVEAFWRAYFEVAGASSSRFAQSIA